MKVGIVSPEDNPIPPIAGGSVQIFLYTLVAHFSKEIELVLISPGARGGRVRIPGVEHLLIRSKGSRVQYARTAARLVRESGCAVVQIDNRPSFVPYLHRACPDVPIVLNLHSMTFLSPKSIPKDRARSALKKTAAINTVSGSLRSRLVRRFPDVAGRATTIRAGVDVSHFVSRYSEEGAEQREKARRKSGVGDKKVILYVGRIVSRKGVERAIRAVRLLKKERHNLELWIVGRLPHKSRYKTKLFHMARGLPVRFRGFVPPQELPKNYLAADLLVCPSQRSEGAPLVILEAAATGLPVLGSKHTGIVECIRHQVTGLLIGKYRDSRQWAASIKSVLFDSDQARIYGMGAVDWVRQDRSWNATADRFVELYSKVFESGSPKDG